MSNAYIVERCDPNTREWTRATGVYLNLKDAEAKHAELLNSAPEGVHYRLTTAKE